MFTRGHHRRCQGHTNSKDKPDHPRGQAEETGARMPQAMGWIRKAHLEDKAPTRLLWFLNVFFHILSHHLCSRAPCNCLIFLSLLLASCLVFEVFLALAFCCFLGVCCASPWHLLFWCAWVYGPFPLQSPCVLPNNDNHAEG